MDNKDRDGLDRMTDVALMQEYRDMRKASFDRIFGNNAKRRLNACVEELHKRDITMEPNIFGDMPIRPYR